jgi:DNA-directed RNA polymerase subunit beta'
MGHIKLASPVSHIWYFKGSSSPLSIILDVPPQALERIIYYALYLVLEVNKDEQKKALEELEKLKAIDVKAEEEEHDKSKAKLKTELDKQKGSIEKKISAKEQRELALQELDLREKEEFRQLSDKFVEQKAHKAAFYDRVIHIVKAVKENETLEEEDYLFLREKGVENCVTVGMGSEVVHELLSKLDLQKIYNDGLNELSKAKGEKRNKLLKRTRVIESFIKSKVSPLWMLLTVLPVIPPDLRPVVQLPGGKFATSDLNDLYRRVIKRRSTTSK